MFAYCNNNPVVHCDAGGTVTADCLDDSSNPEASPFKDAFSGGGSVIGFVIGAAITSVLLYKSQQKKPPNLPSSKKVKLDLEHIISGHMPGGSRNPDGKKSVFWGLTVEQMIKAIYEAYKHSSKLQTQGDRIRLIGISESFNLIIEMWINVVTYVIETAYPKG